MEIRPDYYDTFACIAGVCRHNCCIGWEIDIDDESLARYAAATGPLKEKLQTHIAWEPCAHFVLSAGERCPFLNEANLCELILRGGEGMLCQICRDHPRFYNEVDGVIEKGLGLCCEAAAKLILTKQEPMRLLADDGMLPQSGFFKERERLFSLLQNRERPLGERIARVLERVGARSPLGVADWMRVYTDLERLDPAWDTYLSVLGRLCGEIPTHLETVCEQLLCYFLYRHLSSALDDGLFRERVQFAVLSCYMIVALCRSCLIEELLEVARMYSSEIEYSDENVDILLETLQACNECGEDGGVV